MIKWKIKGAPQPKPDTEVEWSLTLDADGTLRLRAERDNDGGYAVARITDNGLHPLGGILTDFGFAKGDNDAIKIVP